MRGKFITIEGTEGVGKTTNIAFIKQWLDDNGISFINTREPGGTPLAEEIRQVLLSNRDEKVCSKAELLMMFAGRAQHIDQVIEPQLAQGNWVLCDRFTDASYAYQGYGRNLPLAFIDSLVKWVHGETNPDMTLLLDVDIEVGMQRARQRNSLDRIESENMAFFETVRQGYLTRAKAEPKRFKIIDASQDIASVQTQIRQALVTLKAGDS